MPSSSNSDSLCSSFFFWSSRISSRMYSLEVLYPPSCTWLSTNPLRFSGSDMFIVVIEHYDILCYFLAVFVNIALFCLCYRHKLESSLWQIFVLNGPN